MDKTHNLMRLVPWQWNTLSNNFTALPNFSQPYGFFPHIIFPPTSSWIYHVSDNASSLNLCSRDGRRTPNLSLFFLSPAHTVGARFPPLYSVQFAHTIIGTSPIVIIVIIHHLSSLSSRLWSRLRLRLLLIELSSFFFFHFLFFFLFIPSVFQPINASQQP